MAEILVKSYRGDILETVHMGNIAVVDENLNLRYSAGEPQAMTYYRSCSKPIQALPVLLHGLDKKYNLSQKELAILCSSHLAEPYHVETVLGILEKGGFKEEDLIMLPTYPLSRAAADALIAAGKPKRKIYHNCTGKHSGLLMLAKETDADYHDYYKLESKAQQEILQCISEVAQWPVEKIQTGVDGCGVPVYAVPLDHMAYSFLKLACPDVEKNEALAEGLGKFYDAMHAHPEMIRGTASLCTAMNGDPNLVGKIGAEGVYTIGMKKERLGIAIKIIDGDTVCLPMIVKSVLEQLGYKNDELFEKLDKIYGKSVYNDNKAFVGDRISDFKLKKH